MRTIWNSFQTGERLNYQGEHYQFSLLTPFFTPEPMAHHHIPIYIAGVNTGLAKLGGELCEGFHVHSFHTPTYLREVLIPAIEAGGDITGRTREDISLSCAIFVVTGKNPDEIEENKIATKSQIAFYASTPSYKPVLDLHGWGDLVPRLNALLMRNRWDEMHHEISDEMMEHFAVVAPPDELPYKVRERYEGLLDRVGFYFSFEPQDDHKRIIWEEASKAMTH
jgi:probable F420-dependent oxidoreductase